MHRLKGTNVEDKVDVSKKYISDCPADFDDIIPHVMTFNSSDSSESSQDSVKNSDPKLSLKETVSQIASVLFSIIWSVKFLSVVLLCSLIMATSAIVFSISNYSSTMFIENTLYHIRQNSIKDVSLFATILFNPVSHATIALERGVTSLHRANVDVLNYNETVEHIIGLLYSISSLFEFDKTYLYVGFPNGKALVITHFNEAPSMAISSEEDFSMNNYYFNNETKSFEFKSVYVPYMDVRTRHWYISGLQMKEDVDRSTILWNNITPTFKNPNILAITGVRAIYSDNGTLLGVVGNGFDVNGEYGFSKYIVNADGFQGDVLVLNMEGKLVTSSFDIKYTNLTTMEIYYAHEHPNLLISDAGKFLLTLFNNYSMISGSTKNKDFAYEFAHKNGVMLLDFHVWEGYDLKLIFLMLLSKNVLYEPLTKNTLLCLLVSLIIMLVGGLVALVAALCISWPLTTFTQKIKGFVNLRTTAVKNNILALSEIRGINTQLRKLSEIFLNFEKFIPKEILFFLKKTKIERKLWERNISVAFVDFENFPYLTSEINASELVHLLTYFFNYCEQFTHLNSGIVDKYVDSCIMSLFLAPNESICHAKNAILYGIKVGTFFSKRIVKIKNRHRIQVSIGINSGLGLVGFLGTTNRYFYTAIGEVVNVSSGLQRLNHAVGTVMLVGESSFKKVKDGVDFVLVGSYTLKGKRNKSKVYTPVCLKRKRFNKV